MVTAVSGQRLPSSPSPSSPTHRHTGPVLLLPPLGFNPLAIVWERKTSGSLISCPLWEEARPPPVHGLLLPSLGFWI